MAKQTALFLPKGVNNFSFTGTAIAAGVKNTIFTAGGDDSDVKAIIIATDDTAAINLQLWIKRGGVSYLLTTVNIPALSGSGAAGATPAVDLINTTMIPGLPVDQSGKRYLPMKGASPDLLEVSPLANMTAAKILYVSVFGYDY